MASRTIDALDHATGCRRAGLLAEHARMPDRAACGLQARRGHTVAGYRFAGGGNPMRAELLMRRLVARSPGCASNALAGHDRAPNLLMDLM